MIVERKKGQWSESAARVLKERYLWRKDGKLLEDEDGMCARVARAVAEAERTWGASDAEVDRVAEQFSQVMLDRQFMPNSPTLMNAGKNNGQQLSACFVLPVGDSLPEIFDAIKHAAIIHKSGGGTGFGLSRLRSEGSEVATTRGVASGPVSFLRVFNAATEAVKQGGTRRGANMGVLRVDHPDILKFIECKRPDPVTGVRDITNFNISVAATDAFMEALEHRSDYELRDPHSGNVTGTLNARDVFDKICAAAWSTGDPGLLFIDRANHSASNPIPELEQIEATNPCGEQWLGGYDACNLGSINLAECVAKQPDGTYVINWTELDRVTRITTRFLDNVIEINPLPLPEINDTVRANRRVGLGIMGWADLLFLLAVPYDSEAALALGEEVMRFVNRIAHDESQVLAKSRGAFPNFKRSIYRDGPPLRNATLTTVAPTGTISIIADCSSGIEPVFALAFTHMVDRGKPTERRLVMSNPIFARIAQEQGFYSDALMEKVSEHGSVVGLDEVPEKWQRVFVNAHEVSPEWHIKMQAAFQHGVDNSISKCLAAGTLIPTSEGLIAIEDFSEIEEPDTFVNIEDRGITIGGHRVLSHYFAGEKPATRIRLDNGAALVGSTESHRVYGPDGWRRMSDLRVGDQVVGRFVESHGPGGVALPVAGASRTNAKVVRLPERMSPPLAQFLGMLAADGHTTEQSGAVGITTVSAEVLAEFNRLAIDLFGLVPRHMLDSRNSVQYLTLNSRLLCRWIRELIGEGAYSKRVPNAVLSGSAEEKLAFLRGVSLDGYYRARHGLYLYSGMSKRLAYGIAEVCRSFGLPLVRQEEVTVANNGNICHKVVISNELQNLITCIEPHKNGAPHYATYQVLVDHRLMSQTKLPSSHPFYSALRSIKQRQSWNCDDRTASRVDWPTVTPVHRVTAVEDGGMLPLFDIEVEDAHEYTVNGIVSHNTVNLPNESSVQDIEDAYLMAWAEGCKGITVFRDGCLSTGQVLNVGTKDTPVAVSSSPEASPAPQPERPTPPIPATVKPRPPVVFGYTRQVKAPEGTANITINTDETGPVEVFLSVGRAGSDIAALAEALGRLISLTLRLPSPIEPDERLRLIATQLRGIGGSRSIGFGASRVLSLPDALGQAFMSHLEQGLSKVPAPIDRPMNGNGHDHPTPTQLTLPTVTILGNLCPQCGSSSAFVLEEGCKKCHGCGYSEC